MTLAWIVASKHCRVQEEIVLSGNLECKLTEEVNPHNSLLYLSDEYCKLKLSVQPNVEGKLPNVVIGMPLTAIRSRPVRQ